MDQNRPNTGLAVVGALAPFAFTLGAGIALLGGFGAEGTARLFEGVGMLAYAILLGAGFVSLAILPLLILIGRGRRIPVAIPVALATVPWWLGLAAAQYGATRVLEAVSFVNPVDKTIILTAGLSEAMGGRVLGAWFASALLAGTALGLALCAGAMRPRTKAAIGLVAGLPALAMLGVAVLSVSEVGGAQPILFIGLPAVALAIVAALAGLFLGVGVEERPTTSAALGAIVAGGFGVAAGVATFGASHVVKVLEAMASVNGMDRATVLAAGLSGVVAAGGALRWALVLGTVCFAIVLGLAFRRARPDGAAFGAIGVAIVLGVAMIAADATALSRASTPMIAAGAGKAMEVPGVALPKVTYPGEDSVGAALVVTGEGLRYEGQALAITALEPGNPMHDALVARLSEDVRRAMDARSMFGTPTPATVELIVDAKVEATLLPKLAALAKDSGAQQLRFATTPWKVDLSRLEGVPSDLAQVLELNARPNGSVDMLVVEALADRSVTLTAMVAPAGKTEVKKPSGEVAFVVEVADYNREDVALSAGNGVTMERFLDVASHLSVNGCGVVAVPAPSTAMGAAEVMDEERGAE